MQSVRSHNIDSLKEENQDIKEFLLNIGRISKESSEFIAGTEMIEGRKILYIIKDGQQFQLDSLYDENLILDKWFGQFVNQNYRSRYLLFGLGNGMFVRKILENIGPDPEIIVIEPSADIFIKAMEEFDMSDILRNEQVHILLEGVSEKRFRDYLGKYLEYEDIAGSVMRCYLNYQKLFPEAYSKFEDAVRFHVNQINANKNLMVMRGRGYFDNSMANYPFMIQAKSLINLQAKLPKDIPAILVSSGPSLDKNVQELKNAKNKSFIMSVDSAAKVLVKHGIVPDMLISIDAGKLYQHMENELLVNVPLVTNLHCSRGLLRMHRGDKYFLHDENPYIEYIFNKFNKVLPTVAGGGSVATEAYALLERLGFQTIILIGQDLAYTDNRTHSVGTVRGEMNLNIFDEDTLYVEGVNGDVLLTSYEFQIYMDWFEEELLVNPNIKAIDATEGGARIKGTEVMSLKEAIEKECRKEVNIDGIMGSIVDRLSPQEQEIFRDDIHALPDKLENLLRDCRKAKRDYEKLRLMVCKKMNRKELNRIFEDISTISNLLESKPEYYYVSCRLEAKLAEVLPKDLYGNGKEGEEDLTEAVEQGLLYYRTLENELKDSIVDMRKWIAEEGFLIEKN